MTDIQENADQGNHSILLVEDDELLARQMVKALESKGFSVVHCAGGEAARSELKERTNRYFCMVLDIALPDMNGLALLKLIKDENILLPVIIASGVISKEILVQLKEFKLSKVFSKPFDIKSLLERISQLFPGSQTDLAGAQKATKESKSEVPKDLQSTASSSEPGSSILLVEDFYLMAKQIITAFSAKGYEVVLANNGLEAIKELTQRSDAFFCILLDLGLPEIDGFSVLKWMQKQGITTPVIAISGQLTRECLVDLKQYKVQQVFSKPLDLQDLFDKVKNLKTA